MSVPESDTHTNPAAVTRADFDDLMVPTYAPADRVPLYGRGSRVWDQQDREYIDFAAGIAVTGLGHAHPRLVAALTEQAQSLWHVSNLLTNEPALRAARKLCAATFAERVYFANSGSEANETALKMARKYAWDHSGQAADKSRIVAFNNAFHGRTLFAVAAGGQPDKAAAFAPLPPNIDHVDYNDAAALEAVMGDDVCGVIVEPVQGEGGVIPAEPGFLARVRELCDRHGALLIFDEVQIGVGRSGHLYSYMAGNVTPDILTSAKGLGGGFPVAAVLTTAAIADSLSVGSHGSTYGGNPLACAVAETVLDIIDDPAVLAGVTERAERLVTGLREIGDQFGLFTEVRGQGLLIGCVLAPAWDGQAKHVMAAAMQAGLLILVAGPNVIRIAPSLIIEHTDIDEGLARFEQALAGLMKHPV